MCKLNQVVAQIAASGLDVVTLPGRIHTASLCDMWLLIWGMQSFHPHQKGGSEVVHIYAGFREAHLESGPWDVSAMPPSVILTSRTWTIWTFHRLYIGPLLNVNMLIRWHEEEVTSTLKDIHQREGEKCFKHLDTCPLSEFLGVQ